MINLLDSFLLIPFIGGLLATLLLALGSVAFLLRGSVWQGLAIGQGAATGGVFASALLWPVAPVAVLLSALMLWLLQAAKQQERRALMLFIACLAATTLMVSNLSGASQAAARWTEGQIYYLITADLWPLMALLAISLLALPWLKGFWLFSQLAPDQGSGFQPKPGFVFFESAWRVLLLVFASQTLGLPGALAGLLFPAWAGALLAKSYRSLFYWSLFFALAAYLIAWSLAIYWDQPFAPVYVLTSLLLLGGMAGGHQFFKSWS